MKIFSLVMVLFVFHNSFAETCKHTDTSFACVEYVKNYDADTITVNIPNVPALIGKNISVRVRHIDAPEIKGKLPCEKDAARLARNLVENQLKLAKKIELKNVDRDKYFRILADVYVDDRNLSEIIFKNKLAYSYEGGRKEKTNWCARISGAKND